MRGRKGDDMQTVANIFLSFCIYSFLGWVCETIYCSVPKGEFVNRGMLSGPVCPIYGVGALLILYLLEPFHSSLPLLFVASVVVTSALEYFTSVLLEVLFHAKWWDYSSNRFNLHGRICLQNSLLFGLAGVILVLGLEPVVQGILDRIPSPWAWGISAVLFGVMAVDTVTTVRSILSLDQKMEQLAALRGELREKSQAYRAQVSEAIQQRLEESFHLESSEELKERIRARLDTLPRFEGSEELKAAIREKLEHLPRFERSGTVARQENTGRLELSPETVEELRERLVALSQRWEKLTESTRNTHRRLLRAFPRLKSIRDEHISELLHRNADKRGKHRS